MRGCMCEEVCGRVCVMSERGGGVQVEKVRTCFGSAGWLHWISAGMSCLGSRYLSIRIHASTILGAHSRMRAGENL